MKLVATKSFSYNTRRLNPGDIFEAKDPDGRLLIGVLKARKIEDRQEQSIPEPKKDLLNKLADGGKTDTKIPTSFVGEKTNNDPEIKETENKEEVKDEAPAKEEVKDEPKANPAKEEPAKEETPAKEEAPKPTSNRQEARNTRGRGKN